MPFAFVADGGGRLDITGEDMETKERVEEVARAAGEALDALNGKLDFLKNIVDAHTEALQALNTLMGYIFPDAAKILEEGTPDDATTDGNDHVLQDAPGDQ